MENEKNLVKENTLEFVRKKFKHEATCMELLFSIRASKDDGCCYNCKQDISRYYKRLSTQKKYMCSSCIWKVSPMAGTIFENSHVSLPEWFMVIAEMIISKNSISAKEIQYRYGFSYNTSFRMLHLIREWMGESKKDKILKNYVEVDETRIKTGTKGFGRHYKFKRGLGSERMSIIFSMVERNGEAKSYVVPNTKRETLLPLIEQNIDKSAVISTDELPVYKSVPYMGYKWGFVRHIEKQYASESATTNSVEGYFGRLKRHVKGSHIHISEKYLQNYADESDWKYNQRFYPFFEKFMNLFETLPPLFNHIREREEKQLAS